jgi:tRNA-dihydrouridine synthase
MDSRELLPIELPFNVRQANAETLEFLKKLSDLGVEAIVIHCDKQWQLDVTLETQSFRTSVSFTPTITINEAILCMTALDRQIQHQLESKGDHHIETSED